MYTSLLAVIKKWKKKKDVFDNKAKNITIFPKFFSSIQTVTDIDDEVFSYCLLRNVIIPDSVKSIGENAFSHCPLDSIKIPGSVETIGKNAFEEVDHIEYYGKAAYEPFNKYWGAHSMN